MIIALKRIWEGFRETCRLFTKATVFDIFITLIIILNTINLAVLGINELDNIFLYIYTVEAIMKIIGFGFIGSREAYLRDKGNILDFIVVLTGWLS